MSRFNYLVKPWIIMPAIGLLVLGGWGVAQASAPSTSATAQPAEQVVAATTGAVAQSVSSQGMVEASQLEDLTFAVAGTVTAVNATAGQQVAAGDVLAELDSSELEANLSDAAAALAQAEAALADNIASGASSAQLNADRARVTAAEDRLANATKALEGAKLVAPFAGTVSQVNLSVGQELGNGGTGGVSSTGSATGSGRSGAGLGAGASGQPTDTGSGSTPHIQVMTPSSFTVEIGIDAVDIDKIAPGQPVSISLSTSTGNMPFGGGRGFAGGGFPGGAVGGGRARGGPAGDGQAGAEANGQAGAGEPTVRNVASVTGTVAEVSSVADTSSGVAKFPVTIVFDDDSGDYNPGAAVQVSITYAEKQDAVLVPALAISTATGESTVTVMSDGSKQTRTVTTGLSSGGMIEITSGLRAGEEVLVAVPNFVGAGGQGGVGQRPAQGGGQPGGAGR